MPRSVKVDDIVDVSLAEGGHLDSFIVKDVPGNTQIYWELEDPANGDRHTVGPSIIDIVKKA